MANVYDISRDAEVRTDEGIVTAGSLIRGFANGTSRPTTHTPEEMDTFSRAFAEDTPEEIVQQMPVMQYTVRAAELARRGELDNAILEANVRLFAIEARGATIQSIKAFFEQENIQVTDKEGNIITDPTAPQVEAFARRQYGDAAIDANIQRHAENKIGEFGTRGMMPAYEDLGYRNMSFSRGLTEELSTGEVNMDILINPEEYPEEFTSLSDVFEEAAPCNRESYVSDLPANEQEAAKDKCERLGREVGSILTSVEVALNDNEEGIVPTSGMNILSIPDLGATEQRARN